jgi:putative CocE/NonD family hydrolase
LITGPVAGELVLADRIMGHLPLVELDEVAIGRRVDYWRTWWQHQENDSYWQRFRHEPSAVTVPLFQQGGWFDPYSSSHLRTFSAIGARVPNRVLIGPWSHEEEVEEFRGDVDLSAGVTAVRHHELAFYDRYLKETSNGWEDRPALELFLLGRNEWRAESEWPPAGAKFTRLYLRQGGTLSLDPPRPSEPADRYAYDPEDPVPTIGGVSSILTMTRGAETPVRPGPWDQRALERREDVLVYTSAPLKCDVELIGPIEMVLYAASSARDTDWIVRVCDVQPDGRSIFVTEGLIRARYRNTTAGESTELLEPNEVAEYRFQVYPTAVVFARGHCIRLDVTSSSFPRLSRNLNNGEDIGTSTRVVVARQQVLHTQRYPSHLLLPITG